MSARQFVAVRFRAGDRRTYTYHNDGEPVAADDWVKVPERSGDGWSRAQVAYVTDVEPLFATKAILGKLDGADVDNRLALPVDPPAKGGDAPEPDLFS